jgi:hypothetical protein
MGTEAAIDRRHCEGSDEVIDFFSPNLINPTGLKAGK